MWLSGQIGFGNDEYVRFYLHPLLLFVIWGLISAIVLPILFKGALVYTPRAGMDVAQTSPLPVDLEQRSAGRISSSELCVRYLCYMGEFGSRSASTMYRCFSLVRGLCRWCGSISMAIPFNGVALS